MPKSKGQSKQRKPESRSISKRWLPWLRVAWIIVVLLSIILSAVSWSITYQRGLGECTSTMCAEALQLEDTEQLVPAYQSLGLSLKASLGLQIAIEALAMLPYFLVAFILFTKRFGERVGLLGAFTFPAFAAMAIGPASMLASVSSTVGLFARLTSIIGQSGFLVFFLIFPDGRFVPRWTAWIGALWTAMFVLVMPFGFNPLEYIGPGFFLFLIAVIAAQVYRYRKVSGPIEKQQTKWVVIGLVFSIGGFVLLLSWLTFLPPNWEETQLGPITILIDLLVYFFLSSIAIFIGIAILRSRLWDIEVVINRALIYGPLSAILAGVFAASVALINQFAKESFGAEATTTAAVISALVVASVFQPLKGRIEKWINTRIYPDSINLHKEFVEFSPEVRAVIGLKDLLRVITQKTAGLVHAQHTAILLANKSGYRRVEAFPSVSKGSPALKPDKTLQAELQKGRAVSKGDQQGLWVPIYLRRMRNHDVIGVLDIGPRVNKTGFSSDDKKALAALGAEIGASIYTAQLREKRR
jgi:uncharacterized membrane protein